VRYGEIDAALDARKGENAWLTVSLKEGRNREIRRVMTHLGLHVSRLIRIAYGPFQLGTLPRGGIEEVPPACCATSCRRMVAHRRLGRTAGNMRIIGGAWRAAPWPDQPAPRVPPPTVRQALFDMLIHAPWGGRDAIEGAEVLDVFAGTGALAWRPCLAALRTQVSSRTTALLWPFCAPISRPAGPRRRARGGREDSGRRSGRGLVFLDPPMDAILSRGNGSSAVGRADRARALVVAETGRDEPALRSICWTSGCTALRASRSGASRNLLRFAPLPASFALWRSLSV